MRRLGWLFLLGAASLQTANVLCLFFLEGAPWVSAAMAGGAVLFAALFMLLSALFYGVRARDWSSLPLAFYAAALPVAFRASVPSILMLMAAAVPLAYLGFTLARSK